MSKIGFRNYSKLEQYLFKNYAYASKFTHKTFVVILWMKRVILSSFLFYFFFQEPCEIWVTKFQDVLKRNIFFSKWNCPSFYYYAVYFILTKCSNVELNYLFLTKIVYCFMITNKSPNELHIRKPLSNINAWVQLITR